VYLHHLLFLFRFELVSSGLLNRISESNVESITGELSLIFQVCHFYNFLTNGFSFDSTRIPYSYFVNFKIPANFVFNFVQ
jgi:hypothetical protein